MVGRGGGQEEGDVLGAILAGEDARSIGPTPPAEYLESRNAAAAM
jgi:hypothetical protein